MMEKQKCPIGVFDSGVGGLTVVREMMRRIPGEEIVYFGDTARVPYGNKSPATVTKYADQIVRFLLQQDVKAIVVACNTASAFALEYLQEHYDIPIIGVVEPGARAAVAASRSGRIGVIGTTGTIKSRIYVKHIYNLNPAIQVFGEACQLFVSLVEEGWIDDEVTEAVARRYLSTLLENDIDSLILGCTHFPLLKDVIARVVGERVDLIDPAIETADTLRLLLTDRELLNPQAQAEGHRFFISDSAKQFRNLADRILPCHIDKTSQINLEAYV
ncbi:MAG: glutamate racemase [Eubacteriales bacterium]|nr:glutamate racemase [Eubacteriales bacterium]